MTWQRALVCCLWQVNVLSGRNIFLSPQIYFPRTQHVSLWKARLRGHGDVWRWVERAFHQGFLIFLPIGEAGCFYLQENVLFLTDDEEGAGMRKTLSRPRGQIDAEIEDRAFLARLGVVRVWCFGDTRSCTHSNPCRAWIMKWKCRADFQTLGTTFSMCLVDSIFLLLFTWAVIRSGLSFLRSYTSDLVG